MVGSWQSAVESSLCLHIILSRVPDTWTGQEEPFPYRPPPLASASPPSARKNLSKQRIPLLLELYVKSHGMH